jgi:hypothetical protein
MEIVQYGFRELWLVSDGAWTLPVHCDPYSSDARTVTHWCVRPAQQLLSAPFEELRRRFGPCNLSTSRTSWYVTDEDLRRIATKATGCDASQYLKWDKQTTEESAETVGIEEVAAPSRVEEKFLNFMFKRSAIDPKLGRFFWGALKESMLHWLINIQKPIDFELFKLHPIPYRANWKEIMLAKYPACANIFRKPHNTWHDKLVESGFMQDLGSSDLVALDAHSKSMYWTLEIEPKSLWLKTMHESEVARMASKRPGNYLRYYESCIRNRLDDVLKTFAAWIVQIRKPVGRLCESPVSGAPILLPIRKRNSVLPAWHRPDSVSFQPFDGVCIKQGQGQRKSLEKKAKEMLAMSNILQRTDDVRGLPEPGDVGEPADESEGTGGLRLCDANQGQTEVIDVLATRSDGDNK